MMKQRDPYFDNIRFMLIFFVVFGHLLRPYIETNPLIFAVYMSIYSFHMPAFIFISGFFAKNILRPGYVKRAAVKLLVPFALFQLIYSLFYYWIGETPEWSFQLLTPEWSLWFLLSLFFWHILLFAAARFGKPLAAMALAIACGFAAGLLPEPLSFLSIGRTIVFFPFFLAGYYAKKEWFQLLFSAAARLIFGLAAAAVFLYFYGQPAIQFEWLFGSHSYRFLQASPAEGFGYRCLIYGLYIVMIAAVFSLTPRKTFFFTPWGKNTLYVYLLHGFLIQLMRHFDWLELPPSIPVLLFTAAVFTFSLASPLSAAFFRPLLEQKRPDFSFKKGA